MTMQFKRATRNAVKLKILITGPSGSGKTYGALHVAQGLAPGQIGLIDSEHDRASYYADVVPFETVSIDDPKPRQYKEALQAAIDAGLQIVIIDSLSHCWLDILARKDAYDKANPKSNPWTNWALFGSEWDDLIRFILEAPVHVICTARSKMAHEQIEQNGRKQVVKLGMAPQLRENTEYEFAVSLHLEHTHAAQISKDNTNLLSEPGAVWNLVDGTVPALMRQWLSTARPIDRPEPATSIAIDDTLLRIPEAKQAAARRRVAELRQRGLSEEAAQTLLAQLQSLVTGDAPPAMTLSDAAAMRVKLSSGEIALGECDDAQLASLHAQAKAKGRARLVEATQLVIADRLAMQTREDDIPLTPESSDDAIIEQPEDATV